jgi:hypothetical protein
MVVRVGRRDRTDDGLGQLVLVIPGIRQSAPLSSSKVNLYSAWC